MAVLVALLGLLEGVVEVRLSDQAVGQPVREGSLGKAQQDIHRSYLPFVEQLGDLGGGALD